MTKEDALAILDQLGNSPNMKKHALACGFAMRKLYQEFADKNSENADNWEIVGLLHDADYEMTQKSQELHTEETTKKLQEIGADPAIIKAVRAHCDKAPRDTLMAKTIYAVDELTGLIVACALVQPNKKLKSVTVDSVMRKFKDKAFARGANREQIKSCEQELGIPLEEFIVITLSALQEKADELGL